MKKFNAIVIFSLLAINPIAAVFANVDYNYLDNYNISDLMSDFEAQSFSNSLKGGMGSSYIPPAEPEYYQNNMQTLPITERDEFKRKMQSIPNADRTKLKAKMQSLSTSERDSFRRKMQSMSSSDRNAFRNKMGRGGMGGR
jgi:hypothetical protein